MGAVMPPTCSTSTAYRRADSRITATAWAGKTGARRPPPPATPAEEQALKARIAARRLENERAAALDLAETKARATAIWDACARTVGDHPYLAAKGVGHHKLRLCMDGLSLAGMDCKGALVAPMRNAEGEVCSLQFITASDKRFLKGPKPDGLYFSIGNPSDVVCIAEGFATAASVHETTGYATAVAFNCGNLEPVARAIHAKLPDGNIVFVADDDYQTDGNPGTTKAAQAAKAVKGTVAIPDFGVDRPDGATDFNDLARHRGPKAIADAVARALLSELTSVTAGAASWPEPQSLTERGPYPLDALPAVIREAVEEAQRFVKAPIPLVASSALAAVSIAVQAHAGVQRTEGLIGPSSLFLLTIADSGERKSSCDKFFTESIREYEAEKAVLAKPDIASYTAALRAWEAECSGVEAAIKHAASKNQPTAELKSRLADLEEQKPKAPRIPRLMYGDATPEAQAWGIANIWPSGGVLSSVAGAILGSHAMSAESQMRNLAILNVLRDGTPQSFDRRKEGGSFKVEGARFTVALQVQEPTLRAFFDRSGELARGTGFLARFLVAWPDSTQGSRPFFGTSPGLARSLLVPLADCAHTSEACPAG